MKKLSKIRLQNAVMLEEQEMKQIYGGSGVSDKTDKEKACDGKSLCDPCSWYNSYGQELSGHCSQNAFAPYMYCSDLNCHH